MFSSYFPLRELATKPSIVAKVGTLKLSHRSKVTVSKQPHMTKTITVSILHVHVEMRFFSVLEIPIKHCSIYHHIKAYKTDLFYLLDRIYPVHR